jgi:hypothetical protein
MVNQPVNNLLGIQLIGPEWLTHGDSGDRHAGTNFLEVPTISEAPVG